MALTEAPALAYPDARQSIIVDIHASKQRGGQDCPLPAGGRWAACRGVFQARLNQAERNHCVAQRELLAVVLALQHFRPSGGGHPWAESGNHYVLVAMDYLKKLPEA